MINVNELDKDKVILSLIGFGIGVSLITQGIIKTVILILCTIIPNRIVKNRDSVRKWLRKR